METAARPDHGADHVLVAADQDFEDGAHAVATRCQRPARLARSVDAGASRAGIFAVTTTSTGGSSCCASRNDSRISLRMRLRVTALPATFTATARPMRACATLLARTRSPKNRSSMRLLSPYTVSKSRFALRRWDAPRRKRGGLADIATRRRVGA